MPAPLAAEQGDRHAPGALPRDAPVGAVRDHPLDPLLSPAGDPAHRADPGERLLPKAGPVHRDEPLLRRPEDDGALAAPAVRVGVRDLPAAHQRADLGELFVHLRVRVEHPLSREERDVRGEAPLVVQRGEDRQAVLEPRLVILAAVAGRRVDAPGPRLERHVVGQDEEGVAAGERVAAPHPLEVPRAERREGRRGGKSRLGREPFGKPLGDDVHLAARLERDVVVVGVERDPEVGRDRPRRGRPDDEEDLLSRKRRVDPLGRLRERELDVDRGGGVVRVFDLRLRQRRPAREAPVDRLRPLVHRPALHEPAELAQDAGLVVERHRPVRVLPVAQHAEALELLPLDVDELRRVLTAEAALVPGGDRPFLRPEGLVHLVLDRQAVAIPAGDVDGEGSRHRPVLDDHVLEDLVQRVPDVDVPVRVRRAVVEDEGGPSFPVLGHPPVQAHPLPPGERRGLPLGEVGPHREFRLRQVERFLVIHDPALLHNEVNSFLYHAGYLNRLRI